MLYCTIVCTLTFAFFSADCAAQIFMCKDANGRTVTSDRPMPECAERAVRELSANGIIKREIAAPLTPEQKRLKLLAEEQQKIEQAAMDEQKRQDMLLKSRYFSVADIEAARKRARDPLQEKLRASLNTITLLEASLKTSSADKEFYKNKTLPLSLLRKIEETELAISNEKTNVKRFANDIVVSDTKFDETLKRYRDIMGIPPSDTPENAKPH
jgi:Domain of unknown function (DUF4124)